MNKRRGKSWDFPDYTSREQLEALYQTKISHLEIEKQRLQEVSILVGQFRRLLGFFKDLQTLVVQSFAVKYSCKVELFVELEIQVFIAIE